LIVAYPQPTTYDWGIELKEIGQVIGSISVVRQNNDVGSVHIGYCIGRHWWNKGITSEAFAAVISYLMDEVKVNRIDPRHDPRNPYSGKVMEKCGLRYEGTLKESDQNNQGICDASWYALLRKNYLPTN
jgi:Acetyltransferases, including N-acetylases of ribosomal proteins